MADLTEAQRKIDMNRISWPSDSRPRINRRHIDGPLLTFRDGQLHWLTIKERIALAFGRVDAMSLEYKLRPDLRKYHESLISDDG